MPLTELGFSRLWGAPPSPLLGRRHVQSVYTSPPPQQGQAQFCCEGLAESRGGNPSLGQQRPLQEAGKNYFPHSAFLVELQLPQRGKLFPLPRTYSFCSHDRRKLLRASAENSPPPGSLPRSPNRTHYPFLNISLQQTERNSSGRSSRQAGFLLSLFYLFIYFYFLCCSGFCYTLK